MAAPAAYTLRWLICLVPIAFVLGECPIDVDPCHPSVYTEIDDPTRSASYQFQEQSEDDYTLPQRWYRSVSNAGGDMPTSPVSTGNCNAQAPIYLTGDLPEDDEITDVSACAVFLSNGCIRSYTIPVKYCDTEVDTYRVYCLSPVSDAYDRYCFGTELPCEPGTASPTGYYPGCVEPTVDLILITEAEITYDHDYTVHGAFCLPYYIFKCSIEHADNSVYYEVQWYADGVMIQEHVTNDAIAHADMPATLTSTTMIENGYFVGTTLTCRITARSENSENGLLGNWKEVEFFVGAENSSRFEVLEEYSEEPVYYRATLTIPFLCFQGCQHINPSNCDLGIDIVTPETTAGSCTDDNDIVLSFDATQDQGCTASVDGNYVSIPLFATSDHTMNPQRRIRLQLRTRTMSADPFWSEYELPPVHVSIINGDSSTEANKCRLRDDPHLWIFDNDKRIEVQLEGAFVMYKHKTLPILVEVYFKQAVNRRGHHYTRNCGGAVRSGGNIFVFDTCREDTPTRIEHKSYNCGSGLYDMTVTERISAAYRSFKIELPTGTSVVLGERKQFVVPSRHDFNQTEGLCGNYNDVDSDSDDKIIRGSEPNYDTGTRHPTWSDYKEYNDFAESWRVADVESLYFGTLSDAFPFQDPDTVFCACSGDAENDNAQCSVAANVERCLSSDHTAVASDELCRRKKKDIDLSDLEDAPTSMFSYDPDFVAQPNGWDDEWTEASATEFCENYFQSLQDVTTCQGVPNLNMTSYIDACVIDIFMTGNTSFTEIHTDAFVQTCREEVALYVFESENSTDLPLSVEAARQILSQICLNNCSGAGSCVVGVCVCEEGYTGTDCSIDVNHVPILIDSQSNATCDRSVRPCEVQRLVADIFVRDSVVCKLQLRNINYDMIAEEVIEAEYVHLQKIFCPISIENFNAELGLNEPYIVDMSASNNGLDFSDVSRLTVYDSTCWECTDAVCNTREDMCYIDGVCYEDGEVNPSNSNQFCDSSYSINSWRLESTGTIAEGGNSLAASISSGGIAISIIIAIAGYFLGHHM